MTQKVNALKSIVNVVQIVQNKEKWINIRTRSDCYGQEPIQVRSITESSYD